MRLVKQKRVAIKLYLIKIMRSQILHEWLFLEPYKEIFRYDPLKPMCVYCLAVPSDRMNLHHKIKRIHQGADHMRTHIFSIRQQIQRKCVLNKIHYSKGRTIKSSFAKRYYSCKVNNNFIKIDAKIDNSKLSTISRQDDRNKLKRNLRGLKKFKKEIQCESKKLTPLIIQCIDQNIWPMLKYNQKIKHLVIKRQKYLTILSIKYGFHSVIVKKQIEEWLTKFDLRILAIETVDQLVTSKTEKITEKNERSKKLLSYLNMLEYKKLLHYKINLESKVWILSKDNQQDSLKVSTTLDLIVQTLFTQILEPISNVQSDKYNYVFNKRQSLKQAIRALKKLLYYKSSVHQNLKKSPDFFRNNKYLFCVDINQFFGETNQQWLLANYPFPNKFKHILKYWLKKEVLYQKEFNVCFTGFLKKSIIGSSLANFALTGLEKLLQFNHLKGDNNKSLFYTKRNFNLKKMFSLSFVVRYANTFIINTSSFKHAKIINKRLSNFLKERGLKKNLDKSKIIPWKNRLIFDYLGFTFQYIVDTSKNLKFIHRKRLTSDPAPYRLLVYPSAIQIKNFQLKLKNIIKSNLNLPPYRLITLLNPIIRKWGKYFAIGIVREFVKLDRYIHYRIWRYLRRKYKNLPAKKIISRYFRKIKTFFGYAWQFCVPLRFNNIKQKKSTYYLLLLSQFMKFVPTYLCMKKKEQY